MAQQLAQNKNNNQKKKIHSRTGGINDSMNDVRHIEKWNRLSRKRGIQAKQFDGSFSRLLKTKMNTNTGGLALFVRFLVYL